MESFIINVTLDNKEVYIYIYIYIYTVFLAGGPNAVLTMFQIHISPDDFLFNLIYRLIDAVLIGIFPHPFLF